MTSSRMSVGLYEVERRWSMDDLAHAHAILDALDDAEERAMQQAQRSQKVERPPWS